MQTAERLSMDEFIARLDRDGFVPYAESFFPHTPTLDADVAAIARLKARYRAPIFCFGPHASTAAAESMARVPAVDGMFVGEPEDGIVQLATSASFDNGTDVPSLTWRDAGTGAVVPHRARGSFAGFPTMPYPAWDLWGSRDTHFRRVNKRYVIASRRG